MVLDRLYDLKGAKCEVFSMYSSTDDYGHPKRKRSCKSIRSVA
jgi:hypothetical protein